jgi:hypothetical protein
MWLGYGRQRRRPVGQTALVCAAKVAAVALSIAMILGASGTALAEGEGGEGGRREIPQIRPGTRPADVQLGENPEAVRKAYMALLFQEINLRRDKAATPRYEYMADSGSEAVNAYLRDLLPAMVAARSCFHGSDRPGMRAGWDYLEDIGIDDAKVGGEVLACPDVDSGGFWTPPGIADGWWKSPPHWRTLYGDRRPTTVACGAEVPIKGGTAYQTVACITLMGET